MWSVCDFFLSHHFLPWTSPLKVERQAVDAPVNQPMHILTGSGSAALGECYHGVLIDQRWSVSWEQRSSKWEMLHCWLLMVILVVLSLAEHCRYLLDKDQWIIRYSQRQESTPPPLHSRWGLSQHVLQGFVSSTAEIKPCSRGRKEEAFI